ncbi:unnamed protein product, partial [Aphanomyces euteiches]
MSDDTLNRSTAIADEEANNLRGSTRLFENLAEAIENADEVDIPSIFDTPVMDSYLSLRQDAVMMMTNFTNVEFDILGGVREEH